MSNLIELYQKYCPYQIADHIQELEFTFDIERLRQELFKFIIDNRFGFSIVSLRLSPGQNNYASKDEMLETGAINPYNFLNDNSNVPENVKLNKEYTNWHPDLEHSYLSSLVPEIEKVCGLNIGRIRLGWLQPNSGYPMHTDLEPMRLHIPLFTNDLAYFIHDHKIYKMTYGKLYHLITTDIHTAWNFGTLPRLHLILSTYSDDILDNKISKIRQFTVTSKNFKSTIEKQGIDKFSLFMLYSINDSQWCKLKGTDWPDEPKNEIEFNSLSDQIKKELLDFNVQNFENLIKPSEYTLNTYAEITNLLSKN